MNVPKLSGFVDEIALQKSLALILADDYRFADVPVAPEIALLAESEVLVDALWQLPRAAISVTKDGWTIQEGPTGPVGCGLLVEMPEMDYDSPGVRNGSPATWKVGIVGFCEPNTAFLKGTGTGYTSSQLCQIALDVTQMLEIYGFGAFKSERSSITHAKDWEQLKPGVAAHRLTIGATVGRLSSIRSAQASAAFAGGLCTLSCADAGATIRYTTDFSEPVATNAAAKVYAAPFPVASGASVKFATKAIGKVTSPINGATAP